MVASDTEPSLRAERQNGDPEAFELLIRERQRMIHSLCYRMTGSLAEAQDLTQETFLQAYRHLDGFRGQAQLSSWLYRIAVNQCLNWQKRTARREQLHRQWSELDQEPSSPPHSHSAQIQEALMQLNPKQRAAIILTTYDGLSHAEAARLLGCSETTVSWRLFAARVKLKRLLKHLQPREVTA